MKSFSHHLVTGLLKYRILVLVIVFGTTLFFGMQLPKLVVDNNAAAAIPKDLPELLRSNEIKNTFNTKYSLLFTAQFPDSLGLKEKIDYIDQWAEYFKGITIPRENDSTVQDTGLAAVAYIGAIKVPMKGGMLGFKTVPIIGKNVSADQIRTRIQQNREITRSFISDDEKTFLIVLYTKESVDRHKVITKIVAYTEGLREKGFEHVYVTGATATSWYLSRDMKKDFMTLLPFTVIISIILLYLIFHRIRYVIAPLVILVITVIWSFGIMSLAGIPLNVLTTIIPLILFPVGVADSIHVIKTYKKHRKDGNAYEESFIKTFEELLNPILLTSITTFIGFSSFALSAISWTRYFGVFTGFGVMLALLFTIILLPIFLARDKYSDAVEKEYHIIPVDFMDRLIFKSFGAKIILIITIIFSVTLLLPTTTPKLGALKEKLHIPSLHFEGNPIAFFGEKDDVKISDEIIGKEFGGTRFFDIMITAKGDTTFSDSAAWQAIEETNIWLEGQEHKGMQIIGRSFSLYTLIHRMSEILSNKDVSQAGVNIVLKNKKASNLLSSTITPDRKTIKMTMVCKNITHFNYTQFADKIEQHLTEEHPQWQVVTGGQALLLDSMILLLINTQVVSLSVTFILIALVLMFLFRSIRVGIYTTLPIALSSLFIAALMSLFGVSINTVTIIVINSSIGIGIDYAIHFTAGYLHMGKNEGEDNMTTLLQTIHEKGNVIIFNTVAVGIGFLTLLFSSFPPVKALGLFIFLSMAVSTVFSLIFLPLFLHGKHSKHLG